MPPRRRVGLKRMDAAVDALKPMGFPSDLIRRKVKELLKTYGEEGWVFIEEAAYKVLIECILEEQEQCELGEPSSRDSQNDDVMDQSGGEAERLEATPLIEGSEATCSNLDTALATHVTGTALATTASDTTLATPLSVAPLENYSLELKPTCSPAENVPSPSIITASNEVARTDGMFIDQEPYTSSNEDSMFSGPPGFEHFPRLQLDYAPLKRRPSLGWMDPNDNDQTFVLLEPAPVVGWKTRQRPRKRKSRWDVGPDDVI